MWLVLGVFLFIVVWLLFGYINYRKAFFVIEDYIQRDAKYKAEEEKALHPEGRYAAFSARAKLKSDYSAVFQLSNHYKKDPKRLKKTLLTSYLKLGPIYNLSK